MVTTERAKHFYSPQDVPVSLYSDTDEWEVSARPGLTAITCSSPGQSCRLWSWRPEQMDWALNQLATMTQRTSVLLRCPLLPYRTQLWLPGAECPCAYRDETTERSVPTTLAMWLRRGLVSQGCCVWASLPGFLNIPSLGRPWRVLCPPPALRWLGQAQASCSLHLRLLQPPPWVPCQMSALKTRP